MEDSSREGQIKNLYRTILKKEPDPAGLAYWVSDKLTITEIEALFKRIAAIT